ncbi:GGDEF domain-containing protein [Tepidibacillus marianensis]|uniref:GGDEF domain-containing protein n=1 Tax=Tepidibacillus marianensis TaxID=3131995 RepID=UPI0030D1F053
MYTLNEHGGEKDDFFEDITLIIAYIYLVNKLKDWTLLKTDKLFKGPITWSAPFVAGLLSALVMGDPLFDNDRVLDLRAVPVFIIAYIGGLRWGMVSAILPVLYSIYSEGGASFQASALGIILPILIGAAFRQKNTIDPIDTIINIKKIILSFCTYILIDLAIRPLWLHVRFLDYIINYFYLTLFSGISLITIALMLNDSNNHRLFEKELVYLSNHDQLTGLPNRRYYKSELRKIKNVNSPVAIGMIDVDYFKIYNDTHGHVAGDYVLKEIGNILNDSIRKDDGFVARYGGEEFIILFENVSVENIQRILERVRVRVEEFPFQGRETQPNGMVTLSIGISSSCGKKELKKLMEEADQALYQSKENGRNQITHFQHDQKINTGK